MLWRDLLPRPDTVLGISPLFSLVPFLWCVSFASARSFWCNTPGNGTSHYHLNQLWPPPLCLFYPCPPQLFHWSNFSVMFCNQSSGYNPLTITFWRSFRECRTTIIWLSQLKTPSKWPEEALLQSPHQISIAAELPLLTKTLPAGNRYDAPALNFP